MKTALIIGTTGQDGSFLSEFLLEKGYTVFGMVRHTSSGSHDKIASIRNNKNFKICHGDLTDYSSLVKTIGKIRPDEIYNLGAQSSSILSFEIPEQTTDIIATGTLRILEAVRAIGIERETRIFNASSGELFGNVAGVSQCESTPFNPRTPYGAAKQYAFWISKIYREAYNMFICSGITFSHESERRNEAFVTRKITSSVARIKNNKLDKLILGNLDATRDWGYSKDYVECMWRTLQHHTPDDYIIATGETHSIREFCTLAFKHIGIDIEWRGSGLNEEGFDAKTGRLLIAVSPEYFTKMETKDFKGDPSKANKVLGWKPKTSFDELVKTMMAYDLELQK